MTVLEQIDAGDGDKDVLLAYGARSMSVWTSFGNLVWDSGDILEQATAAALPAEFNSTNDENGSFDDRSDDKGPEPALGGTVHASPFINQFPFFTDGVGELSIFTTWPPGLPAGTCFFVQFICQDLTVPGGLILSNGLRGATP